MNARLFTHSLKGELSIFPDETMLSLLMHLRVQELSNISETCKNLASLSADNNLWHHFYTRDFDLLIIHDEAKLQYITAYFFTQAKQQTRPDLAQIQFVKFYTFLTTCQNRAWTDYYLGVMHYYGMGTYANQPKGIDLLLKSADNNDHKAIIILLEILTDPLNSKNYLALREIIGTHRLRKKFMPLLETIFSKGNTKAAIPLAFLHEINITKDNNKNSCTWLEHALDAGIPDAVGKLIDLKTTSTNNIHQYINSLKARYSTSVKILAEIHYQHSVIYFDEGEKDKELAMLDEASQLDHPKALKELGYHESEIAEQEEALTSKQQHLELACNYFKRGFQLNNEYCTYGLHTTQIKLNCLNHRPHTQLNDFFKAGFREGNSVAAILVNTHNTQHANQLFAKEPEKILWLQLAAQSKCDASYDRLLELVNADDPSPYAACALGIIFTFGVLHSSNIQRNSQKAEDFFNQAYELDPQSLEKYLNAGIEQGVFCHQTQKVLKEVINNNIKREYKFTC
ncbi:MAG: F-box-like domain-containing protein [Gammaproteobacteria bacterium]|nr:F-box-like domain-containing protein [Gammaproteobacteria bacterium]MCW5582587.1 F-box-like domain-containing protein [Gammaproteobacteria bacterium]